MIKPKQNQGNNPCWLAFTPKTSCSAAGLSSEPAQNVFPGRLLCLWAGIDHTAITAPTGPWGWPPGVGKMQKEGWQLRDLTSPTWEGTVRSWAEKWEGEVSGAALRQVPKQSPPPSHSVPPLRLAGHADSIAKFHPSTHPDPASRGKLPEGERPITLSGRSLTPEGLVRVCEHALKGWERY